MGFFDFFKKDKGQEEAGEKYWLLAGGDGKTVNPDWSQVEEAVKTAASDAGEFIHLSYRNSGLEIESIQALGIGNTYRVEALPPKDSYDYGQVYVNDGMKYHDVLALFKEFFEHQKLIGFRSWDTRKL